MTSPISWECWTLGTKETPSAFLTCPLTSSARYKFIFTFNISTTENKPVNVELTHSSLNSAIFPVFFYATLVNAHIKSLIISLQQTSKTESESYDDSYEQRLPILADLVLYYCRHAAGPTLIQLYQAEVRPISMFLHKQNTQVRISNTVSRCFCLAAFLPGGWND